MNYHKHYRRKSDGKLFRKVRSFDYHFQLTSDIIGELDIYPLKKEMKSEFETYNPNKRKAKDDNKTA